MARTGHGVGAESDDGLLTWTDPSRNLLIATTRLPNCLGVALPAAELCGRES